MKIVLVHGIGGPRPAAEWMEGLNTALGYLRYPTLGGDLDEVITVDYMDALLNGSVEEEPEPTWTAPEERERLQQWTDYLARKEAMAEAIDGARKRSSLIPFAWVSDSWLSDLGADWLDRVRPYVSSAKTRNAVWQSVLSQLPDSGRVMIFAHSLGSIVMLDLLTRLPADLHVDLLLTIGSPMGVSVLRKRHGGIDTLGGFPASRVGCWVNVYDRDDLVTVGRGAGRHFEAALDAPINTGLLEHGLRAYMGQPVVAAAVGMSAFGSRTEPSAGATVARTIDPQWQPLLLLFAFTHELWAAWPTDDWAKRRRMDLARKVLAQRAVDEAGERRLRYLAQVDASPAPIRDALLANLEHSPLGVGRTPSVDDLWHHAAHLLRHEYADEQLVLAGVDLMLAPPFAPFGIEASSSRMKEALATLAERIRQDSSTISGTQLADAVSSAVKEAKSGLEDDSFPWTPVLVGSGILVLAATGVGLLVAAPAGLAGAALITTTLATFGPGGMAGGVATLAVLTGTSMALTTAGLTIEEQAGKQFADLQLSIAQELAALPVPAFRTGLAGLLAVVRTRQILALASSAADVEATLLLVQSAVLHEVSLHRQIASGSRATKDWNKKGALVQRALDWLAKKAADSGIPSDERRAVIAAIEGGKPAPLLARPDRPMITEKADPYTTFPA
jgi:hypothetical protein